MSGIRRHLRLLVGLVALWLIAFWYLRLNPSLVSQGQQEALPQPKKSWTRKPDKYPVEAQSLASLPEKRPGVKIPQIQAKAPSEDSAARERRLARLAAVQESFMHSWRGYAAHAWMHDEVTPTSKKYKDPFGKWATTLVDTLDTLWIMGLKNEFDRAVLATNDIDFSRSSTPIINVFEVNVRFLGGFLASYELSNKKYPLLLAKAIEVGDLLMKAFDTPNRMPITRWEWRRYAGGADQVAHQQVLVSEIGSLTLEFAKLSQLTGDMKYYDAVKRVSDQFESVQLDTKLPGMWPMVVDALTPAFGGGSDFSLGGMSDSLYEYLPKQYLILGGLLEQPRHLYENFITVAKKHMFWRALSPFKSPVVFAGDVSVTEGGNDKPKFKTTHKAQHQACFAGGMVGIASRIFDRPSELDLAVQLTDGCVWAYNATRSGVGPEIFTFIPCGNFGSAEVNDCSWAGGKWLKAVEKQYSSEFEKPPKADPEKWKKPSVQSVIDRLNIPKGMSIVNDGRYILRPEAIESVFIMYRITGDPEWMEKAWIMFDHIEEVTKTDIASSAVDNVTKRKPNKMDKMESFWLAETLKYFYLIFSDFDLVSLDKWVYNTEAHPLRRPDV